MDELEELVEISSMPDDQVDEEMGDETYDVKEESYEKPAVKVADVRTQGTMFKGSIVWNNALDGKYKNKIVVQPHSSISGGTMKLLNSTQPTLQSTASTTSYRLVNTDGTMIMNVASSQPQTVKKIISIAKPNVVQQATTSKVTLNQNTRVLHIQPQNSSPASGSVKTVTIAKNALTMKAIPAGTIKTLPHAALPGTSSAIQKPLVHLTKAAGQGVTIAPHRIINNTSSQGDSEDATIVIKPSNTILSKKLSTSNIQPRYVPGMKGVQYVRVLNQRAPVASGANPKMIFQTLNKTPAANSSVSTTVGSGSASVGTSKIVLQNNRTYVVRSGIGAAVGPSTPSVSGKPAVLPTTRKIILGGTLPGNAQSLDQHNPPTRIIIKKEVVEPKRLVIAKQPQSSNNIISIVKEGNIKIEGSKQQQLVEIKNETSSTAQGTAMDDKMVDIDTDTTRCRNTDQFAQEFNYFGHPETSTKTFDDNPKLSGKNKSIYSNANNSVASESSRGLKRSASFIEDDISELPEGKHPHNFMTLDVIEATVQCMVAQADECLKRGCSIRTSERMILEEYGRCLLEIKDFALKTEN
ncbi:AGAP010380-PA-like protein [Anopheles sinensis]|uniref:AGAP010380-PA-like protein n=1 Tax=Anopheles sinensis TaxID=74873 RepID=A0A084WCA4_ANOSI|nr:AGAP010380-PA-like protein [Anopheles sinensis]